MSPCFKDIEERLYLKHCDSRLDDLRERESFHAEFSEVVDAFNKDVFDNIRTSKVFERIVIQDHACFQILDI